MSLSRYNKQYLGYLNKYPLLTKSLTSAVFCGLNETVATFLAGESQSSKVLGVSIPHAVLSKLFTMVFYGAFIITPLSHQMYGVLNRVFGNRLLPKMKIAQLITSLSTITPALVAVYTTWLSLINGYRPGAGNTLGQELGRAFEAVKIGMKRSYTQLLKLSVLTSLFTLSVAQNFIAPDLWVVWFTVVYFILGTFQNYKLKMRLKLKKTD